MENHSTKWDRWIPWESCWWWTMMLLLKLLSPSAYGPNVATAAADAISARLKPSLCLLLSFSHSVISESLQPHGLQHPRLPCSSLSPKVCSNSCPFTQWCLVTNSSSVAPFSSCLPTQNQSLFQWVGSSHKVAKVLAFSFQQQSFQWILRVNFL